METEIFEKLPDLPNIIGKIDLITSFLNKAKEVIPSELLGTFFSQASNLKKLIIAGLDVRYPIFGSIKAGKSSILNTLFKRAILHSSVEVATQFACIIKYTPNDEPTLFQGKIHKEIMDNGNLLLSFSDGAEIAKGYEQIANSIETINKTLKQNQMKAELSNESVYILKINIQATLQS